MKLSWTILFPIPLLLLLPKSTSAFPRTKFQQWFPQYAHHWRAAITGPCRQQFSNYMHNNQTLCKSPCACAADCILANTSGSIRSNFASAQVLLGLVPVVLAVTGPTVAEMALLSTYRPLLAFLLAVGEPAVNVLRAFEGADVRAPFKKPRSAFSRAWTEWLSNQSASVRALFGTVTYVVALAAIANNIRNSVVTDMRTIAGWRCATLFLPLAWSLLAAGVHA
ncbi:hypothetical protein K402DRAFT_390748 [Aulographum hederae CBS 113979]|uniref:Uncharacterized protein n=1 Tax=Aulographum hederae CBS 113979 TaxID=1176131 RepID=A0A6G1H9N9_9PEZI|nr:hypothetical protein K402DRAFT_390748 [Aulographum hederae CBS 113979]